MSCKHLNTKSKMSGDTSTQPNTMFWTCADCDKWICWGTEDPAQCKHAMKVTKTSKAGKEYTCCSYCNAFFGFAKQYAPPPAKRAQDDMKDVYKRLDEMQVHILMMQKEIDELKDSQQNVNNECVNDNGKRSRSE